MYKNCEVKFGLEGGVATQRLISLVIEEVFVWKCVLAIFENSLLFLNKECTLCTLCTLCTREKNIVWDADDKWKGARN